MRLSRRAAAAAAGLAFALTAPTSAADGTVSASQGALRIQVGTGFVAVSHCDARANPPVDMTGQELPDVPLLTNVVCEVNGVISAATAPGAVAATAVVTTVVGGVLICRSATALYYDKQHDVLYVAGFNRTCVELFPPQGGQR